MFDEASFVFSLVGIVAVLMASNRVGFDIVALPVVLALMLSVSEALSGFGNPVVIMVAGLLVIGEMLDRTIPRLVPTPTRRERVRLQGPVAKTCAAYAGFVH
jgi:hypothetical protein